MITREEFEELINGDAALGKPVSRAATAIPVRALETPEGSIEETAMAVLFAVTIHIIRNVGLPWQFESRRYADLWRQKFRPWIDQQFEEGGFNPYAVESAGNALRKELESITHPPVRKSWERFTERLRREASEE